MTDGHPDIGPGGCVTWTNFDVPAIWSMLAYEDGSLSAEQATAWNRTYDLLASHAKNLQTLRDTLAERWPPERNEASAVFLEYLDKLISSVNPASYASSSNAVVLSDLIDTLAEAKAELKPLHEQWQAAAASGADPKLRATLNAQAAAIMSSTDVAVYEHGQRFIVPPEYEPPTSPIDTVSPFTTGTQRQTTGSTRPASSAPMRSTAPTAAGTDNLRSNNPILAGQSATVRGRTPSAPSTTYVSSFVSTPIGRVLGPGGVIGTRPIQRTAPTYRNPISSETTTPAKPLYADSVGEEARIDGTPSGSNTRSSADPYNVYGNSSGKEGNNGMVGEVLGGPRSHPDRRTLYGDREPYFEWSVETGVRPILESRSDEALHDPGPGVLGIDR